ncbi:transcription factor GTE1 isoform X3 [Vigna radiata var. radiata]|uniref:Transcription factor GTE1 isoform X3 n=1 Tax=Vigna radiata var. radiata TaxID=3916 RepID=A0A3Q0F0L3_VIGRR|nr:transcription factor GTE1 isoform X3 [Vigna radiata var. radiata]
MDPNPDAIKEDLNRFRYSVSENFNKVQKLEEQVAEVEKFYLSTKAQVNSVKDKGREKLVIGSRRSQQGSSSKEPNSSNAMQEVIQQFSTILHQIAEHKWAWPFLDPVDVEGLGLDDYHEENEQLKEEAHMQMEKQLAQEATYANMAKDISISLCEVEVHLKNLKEMVIEKCRKISIRERLELVKSFSRLNFENLNKALQIISENDPTFKPNDQEVNLDLDKQTDYTVWKLNVFVKKALEEQGKNAAEERNVNHNGNFEEKKNTNKRRKM